MAVGEVWVCSGQSNMEFTVQGAMNATEEIAGANFPLIRHFTVVKTPKAEPQDDCKGKWEVCSPQTVPGFTAVGYFFGRQLHQNLKVPVGLIHSSWGGTPAEFWTPAPALNADPDLKTIVTAWDKIVSDLAGGNIEFWGGGYAPANALGIAGASDTLYDWGDTMTAGGHGCMQVHNHAAGQTLFGLSNWGSTPSQTTALGIGGSVIGTVNATVTTAPFSAAGQSSLALRPDGKVDLLFYGTPAQSYAIQRSIDLANPLGWSTLLTLGAGDDGFIPFTDPTPPMGAAFYRTLTTLP